MKRDELEAILPVVEKVNRGAGEIIRSYYGRGVAVDSKADSSPVTRADREAEAFMREELERHFPDFSVLGEEFGETKRASAYRWIIDPIDGTRSFILNTPLFGTLLALEHEGVPVLGSIYLPVQDDLLVGSASTGTFLNGKPCRVSGTKRLEDAVLLLTSPECLIAPGVGERIAALGRRVGLVRGFGDCYGYFMVARGLADIMIDAAGIKYYDVAPMLPIMQGAGGAFTTYEGRADFSSDNGVATNGLLHDEVLSFFRAG